MSKSSKSNITKRQSAKTDKSPAAKLARERRTVENKARRLFAALKKSSGADFAAADALASLVRSHPWLRNVKVEG